MEADYVIVGAGSAGCAMAYRLSEAGASVLVIEHGGTDAGPFIQMPGALSYPMNMKRYDWGFQSEPEPHLNNRRLACRAGKVIGGSSSINGMVYVRGHACDFDIGPSRARRAGPMPTCCPTSSAWSAGMMAGMAATRPGAAPTGRCM
jgi:choline dehydrogenase-like flavoprotein